VTNGNERLDRIERILEQVANNQEQAAKNQEQAAKNQEQVANNQEQAAKNQELAAKNQVLVFKSLEEMAARQQYHDEAFDRHDAEMKVIREAIAADAENIRALARIAELHHQRLQDLEGGEAS
jgi:hypothetical protein